MNTRWTNSEIEKLKKLYANHSTLKTATLIGRSVNAVHKKARQLNLKTNKYLRYKKNDENRAWTTEEESKLKELYASHSILKTAELLGRSENSIKGKVYKLGLKNGQYNKRFWQQEDIDYLIKSWGIVSKSTIAKNLNRNVNAVSIMAQDLGLGAFLKAGSYITLVELLRTLGKYPASSKQYMKSWLDKGFPLSKRRVNNCSFDVVYIKKFWIWAEHNRSCINFSKVPKYILGKEPEWVDQQRKIDTERASRFKVHAAWTAEEDERLKDYVYQFKYSYYEFEQIFGRNGDAIKYRLNQLGIKARPLIAEPASWTQDEITLLIQSLSSGINYDLISCNLKISSGIVRRKVQHIFGTTKLDRIRKILELRNFDYSIQKNE